MKQRWKVPAKFWRGWGNKLDIKEGANNVAVLKIFNNRQLISDYSLDEKAINTRQANAKCFRDKGKMF